MIPDGTSPTKAMRGRRGRPKAEDSDLAPRAILEQALRLFKKQGLEATSIEQIAAAAGASKTTIYRHYGSKEALAEAAVVLDGTLVLETIRATDNSDADPMTRLRTLVGAIAAFSARPESADLYRLSIAAVPKVPAIGLAFGETGAALRLLLQHHIEAAQTAGSLRPGNPADLSRQLYNAVISPIWSDALLLRDYLRDEAELDKAIAENWDAFLRGAAPR